MLLDIIIAGLLAVTSSYCWRLNRKMAGFRNAKTELEQMIRNFDNAIRQAYESIAILKDNSSDKNIQLLRDMEKVRFLANDLAYLVEKGEKLADTLEHSVRQPVAKPQESYIPRSRAQAPLVAAASHQPPSLPPRAIRAARSDVSNNVRPFQKPARSQEMQPSVREVEQMIDTLARSYVTEQPSAPAPRSAAAVGRTGGKAVQQANASEQKAKAIEKVLNHMAGRNASGASTMPAVPPRAMVQKADAKPAAVAAVSAPPPVPSALVASAPTAPAKSSRFFESLRVITPNE